VGILKHPLTGRRRTLAARSLVGRAPFCVVHVDDRRVSAEHAAVFWTGVQWEVRDLGSSNGTSVNGQRIAPGERRVLGVGSELSFGEAERWLLEDALPPVASARCAATGEVRVAEGGLLALPSASEPRVSIFQDEEGRWLIEAEGPARPAVDLESIDAGSPWILSVPPLGSVEVPSTLELDVRQSMLAAVTLRLVVSRDEEHVALTVVRGREVKALGARTHNYLLLALARARIRDRDAGALPPAEQGWMYVDEVCQALQLDAQQLTLCIYRARNLLAQAGVADAGTLVERRSMSHQIRLGTSQVEVVRP